MKCIMFVGIHFYGFIFDIGCRGLFINFIHNNNLAITMPESEMMIRLLVSFAIGSIIGFEREYLNKSAGFRTMIMISMGSCLFTMFSILITKDSPDRIASN